MVTNSANWHTQLWMFKKQEDESGNDVLVDFHTHSNASDGRLSPSDLVHSALRRGVQRLAITDHDTINGYLAVCDDVHASMRLISGVELSCQWNGRGIHVVGLGFSPDASELKYHLSWLSNLRIKRAGEIAASLQKQQIKGAFKGAILEAGDAQIGRPHFARWMVRSGLVKNENEAFRRFLGQGKVGDISILWPSLRETVRAIVTSGGWAVLAHPMRYKLTSSQLNRLCLDFLCAGGSVIEVISGRAEKNMTRRLMRLSEELNMRISVGSDFHWDSSSGIPLGIDVSVLPKKTGIWDRV